MMKKKLLNYIEENLKKFTDIVVNEITFDVPDFDRHKKPVVCYIKIDAVDLDHISNETTEATYQVRIIFTTRSNKADEKSESLAKAFYSMFENSGRNFDGLVDYGEITKIELFEDVWGNDYLQASVITMTIHNELGELN